MLCDGALRLAALYGVRPGARAVVGTTTDEGLEAALALAGGGVDVAAVADAGPAPDPELARRLAELDIAVLPRSAVVEAHGRGSVSAASVATVAADGRVDASTPRRLECDLVAIAGGRAPASSLLLQAGERERYDPGSGAFVPCDFPDGLQPAGSVAGPGAPAAAASAAGDRRRPRRSFVCLCEDVTEKDVEAEIKKLSNA